MSKKCRTLDFFNKEMRSVISQRRNEFHSSEKVLKRELSRALQRASVLERMQGRSENSNRTSSRENTKPSRIEPLSKRTRSGSSRTPKKSKYWMYCKCSKETKRRIWSSKGMRTGCTLSLSSSALSTRTIGARNISGISKTSKTKTMRSTKHCKTTKLLT